MCLCVLSSLRRYWGAYAGCSLVVGTRGGAGRAGRRAGMASAVDAGAGAI